MSSKTILPTLNKKKQIASYLPYRKRNDGAYEFFLQLRDGNTLVHPNMYSLFGGGIEKNETIKDAMMREVHEELRYVPKDALYLSVCSTWRANYCIFIEEVESDFEDIVEVHEGLGGAFFTYDAISRRGDVSPIAHVATEAANTFLTK